MLPIGSSSIISSKCSHFRRDFPWEIICPAITKNKIFRAEMFHTRQLLIPVISTKVVVFISSLPSQLHGARLPYLLYTEQPSRLGNHSEAKKAVQQSKSCPGMALCSDGFCPPVRLPIVFPLTSITICFSCCYYLQEMVSKSWCLNCTSGAKALDRIQTGK